MTDNDYIAEYVKEKYPNILSFDFALWKFAKKSKEAIETLCEAFRNTSIEDLQITDQEKENDG